MTETHACTGGTSAPQPGDRPILCLFETDRCGRCRRVEGFLAQVLQRRRNHDTFRLCRVSRELRPDLYERFHVHAVPTLLVVEGHVVRGRLEAPHGVADIECFLSQWLH